MNTVITLIAGFGVQLLLYRYLSINGISLNILFLLTIEISFMKGPLKGEIYGFFSGLLEDIVMLGLIGERALVRTIIAFMSGSLKGKFSVENPFFQFFFVFAVYILNFYFILIIRMIFSFPAPAAKFVLINAILHGVFSYPVYKLVKAANAG